MGQLSAYTPISGRKQTRGGKMRADGIVLLAAELLERAKKDAEGKHVDNTHGEAVEDALEFARGEGDRIISFERACQLAGRSPVAERRRIRQAAELT